MSPRCFGQGSPLPQYITSCSLGSESPMRARQRTQFWIPRHIHVLTLRAETLRIRSACLSLRPPGPGPVLTCTQTFTWIDSWTCSGHILSLISSSRTSFYHTKGHRLKPTRTLSHPSDRIPTAKADMLSCYLHSQWAPLLSHAHGGPWISPRREKSAALCLPKPGGFAVVSNQQMLHLLKMQSTGLPGSSPEASVCSVIIWIPLE